LPPSRRPPTSPRFPYTTLFRSRHARELHSCPAQDQPVVLEVVSRLRHARIGEQLPQRRQRLARERREIPRRGPAGELAVGSHVRSEEHTSELQSLAYLVCRLLL